MTFMYRRIERELQPQQVLVPSILLLDMKSCKGRTKIPIKTFCMGRLWIIRGGGHMSNAMAEAHSTKDVGCELRTVVTDKRLPEMLGNGLYSSVSTVDL